MGFMTEQQADELVKEIEKKIDVDKSRRFFKHLVRKDEIKDLVIPPINMPKTLPSLINLAYASDSASASEISNNSSFEEWSNVFGEDGRLHFDQILSVFPPSPELTKREQGSYEQSLLCAYFALASYKEKEGAEFELVAPLLSHTFYICAPMPDFLMHANFLAKPKNSDASPDLFFAELVACGPAADQVLKCSILTPRLRCSLPVCLTSDFVYIWHPEEVDCESCCNPRSYV